jgi:hypothetical protein
MSCCLILEARREQRLFRAFVGVKHARNGGGAEHVSAIAVREFFVFRRVPDEGAALRGFFVYELIDVALGADIDAARGIVHQNEFGVARKRAREQNLLLIAARERKNARVHRRAAYADLRAPRFDEFARRGEIDETALAFCAAEQPAQIEILRDRPDGKYAVTSAIARNECDLRAGRAVTCRGIVDG